jgi:hypothetical protein
MKKQTAAQIRAAQAVVDREEAIEAERERRRAERQRQATLEKRRVQASRVKSATGILRGAAAEGWSILRETFGVFGVLLLLTLGALLLIFLLLPSSADLGQRLSAFLPLIPAVTAIAFSLFVDLLGLLFTFVIRSLPYFAAFFIVLLLLKFAVFPLVRLIIRKAQR